KLIQNFNKATKSYLIKARLVFLIPPGTAFGYVTADRYACPSNLAGQSKLLLCGKSFGNQVYFPYQQPRLLPDFQLFEGIFHIGMFMLLNFSTHQPINSSTHQPVN